MKNIFVTAENSIIRLNSLLACIPLTDENSVNTNYYTLYFDDGTTVLVPSSVAEGINKSLNKLPRFLSKRH
jgi:hypothetical protein